METIKSFAITSPEDLDISPVFSFCERNEGLKEHLVKIKKILLKMLPHPMPFKDQAGLENWLKETLPIFSYTECEPAPSLVTICLLSKPLSSLPTETFLHEMVKRWLVPHVETTILSFHHMQFYFEHYLKESFFIAEMKVLVKSANEQDFIKLNFPLLQKEILSAIGSGSDAQSILETKVLPIDQKAFLVRESLLRLIHRFPDEFDDQILHHFAFTQTHTSKEFKDQRSFRHFTRMITSIFLIRSRLERELRALPEKRHMIIRFIQTKLSFAFGQKPVLGMFIGLNLLHQFEFFEEKHILLSIQKFFPSMRLVSGSFHRFQMAQSPLVTIYVELEKEDGSRFFPHEVCTLKRHLTDELGKRIEHLVPSIFMVRNEEEIMRNILLLSQELKKVGDLPQIMISFDQHSQEDLTFTVVLLRIKSHNSRSIEDLLHEADSKIIFMPDRVQNVRYLDKNYPIEANVFRLQIAKLPIFLRMDFSVNLYLARQEVVQFLTQHLGEVRDYNGGMILKQGELLDQFKRLFQDLSSRNQELLENFFYSLNPIESQATTPLNSLSFFFDLFLGLADKEFPKMVDYDLAIQQTDEGKFAVMRAGDPEYQVIVEDRLKEAGIYGRSLISIALSFEGSHYLGYYLPISSYHETWDFEKVLQSSLDQWSSQAKKMKTLRLAVSTPPVLDPRLRGDVDSSALVTMLFEGLTRKNREGKPECAIAESYHVSTDKLRYTFKLRETYWSDGSPLVAYDFEYAWKKILSPHFSTPFTPLFRPIKNAREAKLGLVSMDEVGVKTIDNQTLMVELRYQAPYFIELTAHTLYAPINHRLEKMHPNWSKEKDYHFICNGPFRLRPHRPMYAFEMERNPYYWKSRDVYFDQVLVSNVRIKTALDMFKKEEIDFIGMPFQTFEDFWDELDKEKMESISCDKQSWVCFNAARFPFSNKYIRLALASVLDREEILDHDKISKEPALTPLPFRITQQLNSKSLVYEDIEKGRAYFEKGLKELQITKKDFPIITLSYGYKDAKGEKIVEVIKRQWENSLGITVEILKSQWDDFFRKLTSGQFQIGMIKWYSWYKDPIYTLDAFRHKDEGINFAKWENPHYQALLDRSEHEQDPEKRLRYLADAEEMLIQEALIIPISYDRNCFMKNPKLSINFKSFAIEGNHDFSQAFFVD